MHVERIVLVIIERIKKKKEKEAGSANRGSLKNRPVFERKHHSEFLFFCH